MNINYIEGNIFNSKLQTVVNTVNCVGVMGKGIALVFRLRYPEMFEQYKKLCKSKEIRIGKTWLHKESEKIWILNFPTKFHWKYESKVSYLESGLKDFLATYKENKVTSIAFPLLGSHNGGLDPEFVKDLMTKYLSQCDIPIEIYKYDPSAPDDMFEDFKRKFTNMEYEEIKRKTKLRRDKYQLVIDCLYNPEVKSMITLIKRKGLGQTTLMKCFDLMRNDSITNQPNLFS